jgi:two-component system, OmpR family, response regulator AdeR
MPELNAPLILIVEDELEIAEGVSDFLRHAGYRTAQANDGLQALEVFFHERPSLVVLDMMLPKLHGLEVLRLIREEASTPVIILTAKGNQEDRLRGFELGADDYVVKPFWPKELVARVDAVLRRSSHTSTTELRGVNGLRLHLDSRTAWLSEQVLELRPVEFDLLVLLVRTPDKVFSRSALLAAISKPDSDTLERTVDAHITNLRRKLGAGHGIGTVHGLGYRYASQ